MANKTTPWNKIKAEYLQGASPKDLGEKYNLTAKQISDKANKCKWVAEKSEISEKIREKTKDKVDRITTLALRRLEDILSNNEIKTGDLVSAIGKAFDISGLKSSRQEIGGVQGINIIVEDDKHKEMLEEL